VAWRPAELLRQQPGFWAALAAVLPAAGPGPGPGPAAAQEPARPGGGAPEQGARGGAAGAAQQGARPGRAAEGPVAGGAAPDAAREPGLDAAEAWRLAAEAYALQALALEAFAAAGAPDGGRQPTRGGAGRADGDGSDGAQAASVWQVRVPALALTLAASQPGGSA
jgi:hypothetical protein